MNRRKEPSIWEDTASVPFRAPLGSDLSTDVCIVGAGIAGMCVAYGLVQNGLKVVVLDDGPTGGGMTGRTTAHLSTALDDRYVELERLHGKDGARLAAESHTAAIDFIEHIVSNEGIRCEFERLNGYLFVPPGESTEILDRELAAAHDAGLLEVAKLDRVPCLKFDTGPCLRFPRQGQFHPLLFLTGLILAVEGKGGLIFNRSQVESVEGGKNARVRVRGGHVVSAGAVVVATNTPINDRVIIHTKQAPYMTYVVAARIHDGGIPRALYWDTHDPYHYVRLHKNDVLVIGGEDHKTGQEDDGADRYAQLEAWARERFPMMERILYRWSGQVMEPVDGLGFIGRNPMDAANVYVVTGSSGNGMTYGALAGILLTDLIIGRRSPWEKLYDPSRKSLKAGVAFAKENLNVAAQFLDYVTPGDVKSEDAIPRGSGAVMREGLAKVAVYRDETDTLHRWSAVCPHLGCIVDWNEVERTWDCPCHGSRFDALGHVINGPANRDLEPVEVPAAERE